MTDKKILDNILSHYGILGMKWGKQRAKAKKEEKYKKMSDDELRKAITRLEMEKRYKDLSRKGPRPKEIRDGLKTTNDILSTIGKISATGIAAYHIGKKGAAAYKTYKAARNLAMIG